MLIKSSVSSTFLPIAVALLGLATPITRPSRPAAAKVTQNPSTAPATLTAQDAVRTASPCAEARARRAVCQAANDHLLELMKAGNLEAVTVAQDVRTGAVVAFAASRPADLDVTTPVNPRSLSKLFLAASWWDRRLPGSSFESTNGTVNAQNPAYGSRVSIHEMLVGGSDSAGRQMAVALRRSAGTKSVLEDFRRYGLGQRTDIPRDDQFWGELAPAWQARLIPAPAYASLNTQTKDAERADTLSLGETNMRVSALHVSRFLQAVGNQGLMLKPVAREARSALAALRSTVSRRQIDKPVRVMREATARQLQAAMRDTVQRGPAVSIAKTLEGTDWQIGGKTGSGPGMAPSGPQLDGWFAGLIFDPRGVAQFTVATFVRNGGRGGGNAAKLSAELAHYLIGEKIAVSR